MSIEAKKLAKSISDRKYREKNRDKLLAKNREYYLKNKERMSQQKKDKYKENPEPAKLRAKNWKKNNRARHNAICMARHARKLNAMPDWLSEFMLLGIDEIYSKARELTKITGIDMEVDHIVPLQGDTVCGLHVPWNLQILDSSTNYSKNNSLLPEDYLISKDGYKWIS